MLQSRAAADYPEPAGTRRTLGFIHGNRARAKEEPCGSSGTQPKPPPVRHSWRRRPRPAHGSRVRSIRTAATN